MLNKQALVTKRMETCSQTERTDSLQRVVALGGSCPDGEATSGGPPRTPIFSLKNILKLKTTTKKTTGEVLLGF